MLKIDSDKIWKLLKKDSTIQKKLAKYIFEEEERVNRLQSIYDNQVILLQSLENKKLQIEKEEQHYKDTITRKHGDISFLEIRKAFAKSRIAKLAKILENTQSKRKQKYFLKKIERIQEDVQDLESEQEFIKEDIANLTHSVSETHLKWRNVVRDIDDSKDKLEIDKKNLRKAIEERDVKTDRFYRVCYEEVTENFKPCQDLVVPDLTQQEKITKKEAKEKANPIVIDETNLLSSPLQERARPLTTLERQKVRELTKDEFSKWLDENNS